METITHTKKKFQVVLGFENLALRQITRTKVRSVFTKPPNTLLKSLIFKANDEEFWDVVDFALDLIKVGYKGNEQPQCYSLEEIREYFHNSSVGKCISFVEWNNQEYEFVWKNGYRSGILNYSNLSIHFHSILALVEQSL